MRLGGGGEMESLGLTDVHGVRIGEVFDQLARGLLRGGGLGVFGHNCGDEAECVLLFVLLDPRLWAPRHISAGPHLQLSLFFLLLPFLLGGRGWSRGREVRVHKTGRPKKKIKLNK